MLLLGMVMDRFKIFYLRILPICWEGVKFQTFCCYLMQHFNKKCLKAAILIYSYLAFTWWHFLFEVQISVERWMIPIRNVLFMRRVCPRAGELCRTDRMKAAATDKTIAGVLSSLREPCLEYIRQTTTARDFNETCQIEREARFQRNEVTKVTNNWCRFFLFGK